MNGPHRSAFSLLLMLLPLAGAADQSVPEIQVTHTWGDLLRTKPIIVGSMPMVSYRTHQVSSQKPDPVRIWVGIDRDHVASYGSVLFYCAAKCADFTPRLIPYDNLGPLSIRAILPGAPGNASLPAIFNPASVGYYESHFPTDNSSYLLFMRSAQLEGPAVYPIQLLQPVMMAPNAERILLAQAKIVVAGQPSNPWTPWGERYTDDKSGQVDNAPDEAVTTDSSGWRMNIVCNPPGGIAIPAVPKKAALFAAIPDLSTPLPQLLPDPDKPEIHISLDGNYLSVKLNQKQVFWSYLQDVFLTRWWVNDKPWIPDPVYRERCMRVENTVGSRLDNVQLHIAFHPDRLHVKKGDKVGLQLLYTPGSWQIWFFSGIGESDSNAAPSTSTITFISNRIEFVYSGDPRNFQAR